MENESFPLSEELIVLCSNREAMKMNPNIMLDAFCALEKAKDYPSFEWCLKNLHILKTNEGREFAIKNIYDFISSSWHQIPENIYPFLIEELFTKIWQDPNFQDKSYHSMIFKAQNLAIYGLYPKYWPNFFDFLLNLPKPILYGFLSSFNYSIYTSASTSRRDIDELCNNCLKDGSQAKILQVVVTDVLNRVEGAGDSLISTAEWVSLSLLLNSNLISLFTQLLGQPDTCKTGLNIFISIFRRPIAQDRLYELVTQLQLVPIINQIATNSNGNMELINLCSKLLFTALNKLVSSQLSSLFELISNTAELSMNLFMFPNKESTNFNYRLLMTIFSYYPMLSSRCFPMLIRKISLSIALNSADSDLITITSLRLLFISANTSGINVIPHLIELAHGLNPKDQIIEAATLLASLNNVISSNDRDEINLLLSLGQMFSPLLSIQPPFSPPHFIAMSNYLQLIQSVIHDFDPTFLAQIFVKCIELVTCKQCINTVFNDRNNLLEAIFDVCKEIPNLIATIPYVKQNLPAFVQTGENCLIKSAALIVSTLNDDERFQFYSQILPFFAVFLKLNVQKNKFNYDSFPSTSNISSVLEFWILSNTNGLGQLKPPLMNFFSLLYSENFSIFKNQEMFHFFCEASVKSLGVDAFQIFWNSSEFITEFENAAIIVQASIVLAQNPPYDDRMKIIFEFMNNVFGAKNHSNRSMRHYEEVLQMRDFYEAATDFLLLIIPNLQQNSNEQMTSISHLMKMLVALKLSNLTMNKVVLFFLTNPKLFTSQVKEIFTTFMSVLDEFRKSGTDEQRVLLINLMRLIRIISSLVAVDSWSSPLWSNIENFRNNGPLVFKAIMDAADDEFQNLVIKFLENVEPPKVNYDDDFDADTED